MIPERFCITIEGKLWDARERSNLAPKELTYFIARLIGGEHVPEGCWGLYGLRVTVEECTDQGDDGPDYLSVPRGRPTAPDTAHLALPPGRDGA